MKCQLLIEIVPVSRCHVANSSSMWLVRSLNNLKTLRHNIVNQCENGNGCDNYSDWCAFRLRCVRLMDQGRDYCNVDPLKLKPWHREHNQLSKLYDTAKRKAFQIFHDETHPLNAVYKYFRHEGVIKVLLVRTTFGRNISFSNQFLFWMLA